MALIDWSEFTAGYGMDGAGVGAASPEEVAELNKAMTAGGGYDGNAGVATPGALGPLMPESLDNTLASMTYTEEEMPMWKGIFKDAAYNTAEEYNRLHSVGQGDAAFIAEGDLPEEEDSKYSREITLIKFMGVTRRVSHVASLVKTRGVDSAIAAETRDGTLWLMRQLEENLFFGDSQIIPLQFDGLNRLMVDGGTPTFDLRGGPLTEEVINGMLGAVRAAPNYGRVDTLHCSLAVKSDVANLVRDRLRSEFGGKMDLGIAIDDMTTQHGKVKLQDNIFILEGQAPYAAGLGKSTKRPLPPVLTAAITSPVLAGSLFAAGDAGTYFYKVVGVNRFGRSTPLISAGIAVAAGDEVLIPVQDGGQDTTGYIVYRSDKDGLVGTCKEAFRVRRTGATQTIHDTNAFLPGCSSVFGMESKPQTWLWKQLAPFTKLPLATVDTSIRWMQVLYGAPQLRKPRHCFRIINVGRDPNAPVLTPAVIGFE